MARRSLARCSCPADVSNMAGAGDSVAGSVAPPAREVRLTPGISCEAVRTAAKRRNARGGTAVRLRGAATSFVCFIPLFGGAVHLEPRILNRTTPDRGQALATTHAPSIG